MRMIPTTVNLFLCLSGFALNACGDDSDTKIQTDTQVTEDTSTTIDTLDNDGDGVAGVDGDCDDEDPDVYPGRSEDCNGEDDNCNGLVDEGFGDTDLDGIADCMDVEECDGLDNDGDGEIDEDFADADGDGVADCMGTEICDGLDNDGDGDIDEDFDADGDGFTTCGSELVAADCDDSDADIYPGALEIPVDGVDNDCDGLIDEGAWAAGDLVIIEVMSNPAAVSDANGEWFEVYNSTGASIYLNGLIITSSDGDYHQVTSDEVLELDAYSLFVFGINEDYDDNGWVHVDYEYDGVILSNEEDDLILMAEDLVVDEITWDDGWTMPDTSGASMTLDPWYYDSVYNDDGDLWCPATDPWDVATDLGSPGDENEYCSNADHDFDGYTKDEGDCDDGDPDVYPGAPELDADKDNDCDGEIEVVPTAGLDVDPANSTFYTCDVLYLDGSSSVDPDGTALTYDWELTSVPSGSANITDDIEETSDESPTFTPDTAGDYEFTLTITDEGDLSDSDSLIVSINDRPYNDAPVADAGADQSASGTASCSPVSYEGAVYTCSDCSDYDFSLDAGSSSDANNDILYFSWAVTSGSASLDDSSSETPILTVTGPAATYGATSTETVDLQLVVTDCMGETSTDTITIIYNCTGS